ncbi:hypothetical protein CP98_00021 [Sphingobium yanoikuyae]|uniref:Heparan-alpha-glucosaminide N-acetyltransferase catalytic domain-containing protein n=1 Tax=Sphingobium yanoikuyae TaxID=13690 RepID=A0A084ETQ2_SPHYA|nr:hypothetical protein CP98_00021 [Sphingobium yanoikuyae]
MTVLSLPISSHATAPAGLASASPRIGSIDALRGFVMLVMMVDHVREFFYFHAQVPDPMDAATTPPALFFTRLAAHVCAPVFVALTGLSAYLYGRKAGRRATSAFLVKRGLFLIALELTLVSFGWNFTLTPPTIFLQVIWAIGLSMLALAALIHLPRLVLVIFAVTIMLGHNLLDPIAFAAGEPGHALWAVLHDRGFIDLPWDMRIRTSYPLLPWIGVIAIGYAIGPWFAIDRARRQRRLLLAGGTMLALFLILRTVNLYGEPLPWSVGTSPLRTLMSFLNLTKYPPSADFLLLMLGCGTLLLVGFERLPQRWSGLIAVFGAAPLFYYLLHLYLLHILHVGAVAVAGQDGHYSLPGVASLWLLTALLAFPLWYACRWFGAVKRRSGQWWMRYL